MKTFFTARVLLILLTYSLMNSTVFSAEPVSISRFGDVAIGGHDSVAYHGIERDPQAAALEGSKSYTVEYKGATWRFSTQNNSRLFSQDPEKYSPAYNGHCANALSLGEGLIRTDGTHWEIFGDKLYLFYAARGRHRWMDGNWEQYKSQADAAWAALSRQ